MSESCEHHIAPIRVLEKDEEFGGHPARSRSKFRAVSERTDRVASNDGQTARLIDVEVKKASCR